MAKKLVQRLRKIVNFHVDVPRELQRQLRELENGFYGALDTLAGNLGDYLGISGLDGVKVVPGGGGVLVARRSRESITVTAGGTITGSTRKDVVRFESLSAHVTAYGIVEPGADDTHRLLLINATDYTVTLAHNSTASAARRFLCPHSVDYELRPNECIEVEYQEVATEQRWRVLGDSKPLHIVRSLEDLPTPVAGVITLPELSGLWLFTVAVDITPNRLVVKPYAHVMSTGEAAGCDGTTSGSTAVVTVEDWHQHYPFRVYNYSTGKAVHFNAGDAATQEVDNWLIIGDVLVSSLYLRVRGGAMELVTLPGVGGTYVFDDCFVRAATVGSGTSIASVRMDLVRQVGGSGLTRPMLEVPNGIAISQGVFLDKCEAGDGKLLKLGTGINAGGAAFPKVEAIGCVGGAASGDIEMGAIPAGGLEVLSCRLHSTPYSGFDHLTAGVHCYGNYTAAGVKLTDTPNGHIVKNNAGTQQTQRHYLKAGDGLEATDDGTNTVLSVSETTVEATLTFADDTTYGFELSGVLSLSSLPMNCVAALRVACAWGVTEASGGEETDIDQDGVLWVYVHVTKNNGTLMAVQFTNDRDSGFPVPELHVVHEAPAGDGNDPATEVSVFVQASSNNIEVIVTVPGSGVHSGPTFSGTATLHTDCVHERTALP